jgi:hypothetical protein
MPIGTSADGSVCTSRQFSTLSLTAKALPGRARRSGMDIVDIRKLTKGRVQYPLAR